jgi:hypothetical protein
MLFLLIIVAVIVAVYWKTLLKVIIAALIVGFVFLCVSGLLDIMHGLHTVVR